MRPQSMAPIVRELEEAGLVQRRPDADERERLRAAIALLGRIADA